MQRKTYIDVAKGIAISSIVICHILTYCTNLQSVYKIIYVFNVPLFFLISGYLFNYKDSISTFLKKKINRLLVPYFIYSLLFIFP